VRDPRERCAVKAFLKRRFLFVGLLLAVGASVAGAVMATGALSAAPPAPTPKPVAGQLTIYSGTFTPYKRFSDEESLQLYRYQSGPGNAPNTFSYSGDYTGDDAFFNTPDLTIGATPMSAVSAQVCLTLENPSGEASVKVYFGVQGKDQKVTYITLTPATTGGTQQCPTLTFQHPVTLVNHPHLVVTLEMTLATGDRALVDGVTYTLQPTQKGDVTPGS
jgi:hypothetical protein